MSHTKNSTPAADSKFTGMLSHARPLGYGRLYRDDIDQDQFRFLQNSYKVIYFTLLSYTDNNGVAFPSQVTLAKITGFNRVTINVGLQTLRAHGFLRQVGEGPKGVIEWQITAPEKTK